MGYTPSPAQASPHAAASACARHSVGPHISVHILIRGHLSTMSLLCPPRVSFHRPFHHVRSHHFLAPRGHVLPPGNEPHCCATEMRTLQDYTLRKRANFCLYFALRLVSQMASTATTTVRSCLKVSRAPQRKDASAHARSYTALCLARDAC